MRPLKRGIMTPCADGLISARRLSILSPISPNALIILARANPFAPISDVRPLPLDHHGMYELLDDNV